MVSVLASSAIDCGYELRSCQTKEYKIGIGCFSAKNATLREKNNVSEWSDISTQWLLAHLAKGKVSFYHDLARVVRRLSFVVCRPLTIHIVIFSSETPQPNEVKLSRTHLCKIRCNDYSFRPDPLTHMVATSDSCFWLADFIQSFPLKLLSKMNRNLEGSNYGRFSITIAHFISICWQTWSPQTMLVSDWPISSNLLLWNCLAKWAELWWEAPIEGSVCIKFPQSRMKGKRSRLRPPSLLFLVRKARTFVVSQLVTNVALIEYT